MHTRKCEATSTTHTNLDPSAERTPSRSTLQMFASLIFRLNEPGSSIHHLIHSWVLYTFVIVVACLCIIANLMGVATATLVIPGLQYIDINMDDSLAFNKMLSADPPSGSFIRGCEPCDLSSGFYACTNNLYASSLDQLIESAVSTERQQAAYEALLLPPVSQEEDLSLSANVSDDAGILSRPQADNTTQWLNDSHPDYSTYPDSRRFNQLLQTQLQRAGPTIGLTGDCWSYTGAQVFRLANDRTIRCYGGLFLDSDTTVTKCIRWGAGWGAGWGDSNAASSASFTIPNIVTEFDINATVYTTPSARYLRDTTCINNGNCNWDLVWCDNTGFLSFAIYAVDPSPISNLLHLAQLGSINATNSIVDGTRASATSFVTAYQRFVGDPDLGNTRFNLIQTYITLQAASLIPYTTRTLSTSTDRRFQRERELNNPYTAATLQSWATVQLWKYGIDSRTKRLGVVILIIGMVIVLATTIMWIESPLSPTRVVVAALFHNRPVGLDEKDEETGRPLTVRYNSADKHTARAATFTFRSPRSFPPETPQTSPAPPGNRVLATEGKGEGEALTVQETGKI
ncbi:hypothetical protein BJX64DRAFT_294563 [Aspergillus heterothallicus]